MKKIEASKAKSFFYIFSICFSVLIFITFSSCKNQTEIHLHDRHGLSYDSVKNYAEKNGAITLVLLDYHHDIRPEMEALTSVNWVGKLVEENYVKKVIWLSGKKLLLPNRNSRMAWLERSLAGTYPTIADKIRGAVQLVDWYDLQEIELKEPFAVTLDFDVFTKDPGEDVELFVDELCTWIQKQNPELVTLSFSAAYQPEPKNAWNWLLRFLKNYNASSTWFLESSDFGEKEESMDEFSAHETWKKNPEKFMNQEYPFFAGAYFWQNAPDSVKANLIEKKISAGNKAAEIIIAEWQNEKLQSFRKNFDFEKLNDFAEISKTSMNEFFSGKDFPAPYQNIFSEEETFGVAVRFKNIDYDRGCLSLYSGISSDDMPKAIQYCTKEAMIDPRYERILPKEKNSLITNISIFSTWEPMNDCFDFEPGLHSLLLEDTNGEKTLLQAAIALERNYTREEFLGRLANKAGLGLTGWQNKDLKFYKADTITYYSFPATE
ncbi:MAG: AMMECR1 family protein [Treponema sp.]|nr:AMMECR1 family protein [Treponema sp.]